MAMNNSTRAGIALSVFGVSMILASGPAGLAFGAALLTSIAIVATVAAIASVSPRTHFGFWPLGFGGFFHRPWFGSHSRTFVPGGVHTPRSSFFGGGPSHTTTFRPAASYTPSYRAPSTGFFGGFGGGTHVGRTFVPGGLRR